MPIKSFGRKGSSEERIYIYIGVGMSQPRHELTDEEIERIEIARKRAMATIKTNYNSMLEFLEDVPELVKLKRKR